MISYQHMWPYSLFRTALLYDRETRIPPTVICPVSLLKSEKKKEGVVFFLGGDLSRNDYLKHMPPKLGFTKKWEHDVQDHHIPGTHGSFGLSLKGNRRGK